MVDNIFTPKDVQRFWNLVNIGTEDECWPLKNCASYGKFKYQGIQTTSNRFALMIKLERQITPGYNACHECDNPPCCNPNHIYEGTQSRNRQDAFLRNRVNLQILREARLGKPPANSILTEDDVAIIKARLLRGDKRISIEVAFGVSKACIQWIAVGRSWSWVKPLENLE